MKRIITTIFLALCVGMFMQPFNAGAADTKKDSGDKNTETTEAELPKVPAVLKDKKFVLPAKFNTNAKVYFIYKSRSTCGICVAEAPAIVKAYQSMRGKDAELVMLNLDQNKDVAAKWAKSSKMKFPIVAPGDAAGVPFPYGGEGLLPIMVAVDADGNKLGEANASGVSAFVTDWRKLVRKLKKEEKAKAKEEAKKAKETKEEQTEDSASEE